MVNVKFKSVLYVFGAFLVFNACAVSSSSKADLMKEMCDNYVKNMIEFKELINVIDELTDERSSTIDLNVQGGILSIYVKYPGPYYADKHNQIFIECDLAKVGNKSNVQISESIYNRVENILLLMSKINCNRVYCDSDNGHVDLFYKTIGKMSYRYLVLSQEREIRTLDHVCNSGESTVYVVAEFQESMF